MSGFNEDQVFSHNAHIAEDSAQDCQRNLTDNQDHEIEEDVNFDDVEEMENVELRTSELPLINDQRFEPGTMEQRVKNHVSSVAIFAGAIILPSLIVGKFSK